MAMRQEIGTMQGRGWSRGLRAAIAAALVAAATGALAQAKLSEHVRKDVERHRAMAAAHENAARCLESGRPEQEC
ncbi:hypothetical protein SMA60_26380, partial [Escherichia coli]|uniref:hypothetical protein n=1 Tax=Escherichia coli TaxID=562 RepID=UPI00307A19DA